MEVEWSFIKYIKQKQFRNIIKSDMHKKHLWWHCIEESHYEIVRKTVIYEYQAYDSIIYCPYTLVKRGNTLVQ